jgi:putative RNA 2'-phosphotransferase
LEKIVAESDKQRFGFDATGKKIRANQGHSVIVDLALTPVTPPDILYHGTAVRLVSAIMGSGGLTKQARHHVHLSETEETARKVGARHGKPCVLRIDARAMREAGHVFYRSDNGVWLTDSVPTQFFTVRWEEPPP